MYISIRPKYAITSTLPVCTGLDDASASERELLTRQSESYGKILFSYVMARRGAQNVSCTPMNCPIHEIFWWKSVLVSNACAIPVISPCVSDNIKQKNLANSNSVHTYHCRGRVTTRKWFLWSRLSLTKLSRRRWSAYFFIYFFKKFFYLNLLPQDLQVLALDMFASMCPLIGELVRMWSWTRFCDESYNYSWIG